MRALRRLVEAAPLWLALRVFRLLGIERASALGGWLGRHLGRTMASRNRIARRNLRAAFPEKSDGEIDAVLRGMWDNLGRGLGELPHIHELDTLGGGRVEVTSDLDDPARAPSPAIYFSAHFGNFEVATQAAIQRGVEVTVVYREASNPFAEAIVQHWRGKRGGVWAPKGREGARALLAAVRRKEAVAIMADQKLNEGVPVPFFGRDAMTAPAIAELALRHDAPLVPVRVSREPRARFRVHLFEPVEVARTGDRDADTRAVLTAINETLEGWIREKPDHWLWIHRRWPD